MLKTLLFTAALGLLLLSSMAGGQTGITGYDAVSVKVNKSGTAPVSIIPGIGSFQATNVSLAQLLTAAYGYRESSVAGLPGWAGAARFDVNARFTDADPEALKRLTWPQQREFIAGILTGRFNLKTHVEKRMLPVYELVVTAKGPKFKENTPPSELPLGDRSQHLVPGNMILTYRSLAGIAVPVSSLAMALASAVDRDVFDKTELTGVYDFNMKWTPDQLSASPPTGTARPESPDAPPSIFQAIQDQLGLKLVASKGLVDVLIIDRVEMPSEN